jgi:hypothetical protein
MSFQLIRIISNTRTSGGWKSQNGQMFKVSEINGIHITVIPWKSIENKSVVLVHVTYRAKNNIVIHYGLSIPKFQNTLPKFWGSGQYNEKHMSYASDKMKKIYHDFIKINDLSNSTIPHVSSIGLESNWRDYFGKSANKNNSNTNASYNSEQKHNNHDAKSASQNFAENMANWRLNIDDSIFEGLFFLFNNS